MLWQERLVAVRQASSGALRSVLVSCGAFRHDMAWQAWFGQDRLGSDRLVMVRKVG